MRVRVRVVCECEYVRGLVGGRNERAAACGGELAKDGCGDAHGDNGRYKNTVCDTCGAEYGAKDG